MIVDCHTHVGWQDHGPTAAVRHMDKIGVDKAWVLSWEDLTGGLDPSGFQHLPIGDVMKACAAHPDRLIPFCGVDPRHRDAEGILRRLVDQGCKGYGEQKLRLMYDNCDLIRMYKLCAQLRLPVLVHIDVPLPQTQMWYGGSVDVLERALKQCPQTNFIGHGPGFWREISGNAGRVKGCYPRGRVTPGGKLNTLLAKYKNLYADLSAGSGLNALKRDVPHAKGFVRRFRKKLLYGTDIYTRDHLDFLEGLGLEKKVFDDITGRNALRLVKAN